MNQQHPAVPGNLTIPHVAICHHHPVTTSLNVACVFDKAHDKVLKSIRELDVPAEFAQANFGLGFYIDLNSQKRPMYEITRDGLTLLAMGFTGKTAMKFKIAYIEAFNAMESELVANKLISQDDYHEMRRINTGLTDAYGDLIEENMQLKDELLAMHRKYLGQIEKPKIKRKPVTPVTDAEVMEMRRLHAAGMSNADIARQTGRSAASVSFSVRSSAAQVN